jgi:phytoene synthase
MSADYGYCQSLVRERDYDRFLADLFASAEERTHLFALHAFEGEIVHVADAVREPMAGEIRYQWWRDVINGERAGEAAANPVAAALLAAIAVRGLPRDLLLGFIDKHSLDLADAPPDNSETVRAYIDATAVASVGLSVRVLVGEMPALTPAVLAAGRAIGVSKILINFTRDAARGRLFVPLDLLAKHDVHTRSVFAGESSAGLSAALRELKTRAFAEIESLQGLAIPVAALPAFLPVAVLPRYLARMDRSNFDPFRTPLETSRLRRQFTIWRSARRGAL